MARIITTIEIEAIFKIESERQPPERITPDDDEYFEIDLYERTEDM